MTEPAARPLRRVMLTNDDGIDAPGLAILESVAAGLAEEVWVVAPERDQSGMAQSLTLTQPLRLIDRGPRRIAVTGTPADAVSVGLRHVLSETSPDLVLSGVNRGANLANDIAYSGTVGAAMTAALLGCPAMALSQGYLAPAAVPWQTAETLLPGIIRQLWQAGVSPGGCFNINLPPIEADRVRGIRIVPHASDRFSTVAVEPRHDARGREYVWLRYHRHRHDAAPETDLGTIQQGYAVVTPLMPLANDRPALDRLRALPLDLASAPG